MTSSWKKTMKIAVTGAAGERCAFTTGRRRSGGGGAAQRRGWCGAAAGVVRRAASPAWEGWERSGVGLGVAHVHAAALGRLGLCQRP